MFAYVCVVGCLGDREVIGWVDTGDSGTACSTGSPGLFTLVVSPKLDTAGDKSATAQGPAHADNVKLEDASQGNIRAPRRITGLSAGPC